MEARDLLPSKAERRLARVIQPADSTTIAMAAVK